jgi:hypothetical protein
MPVAQAIRHNQYNQGGMFRLGLSTTVIEKCLEANTDRTGVSR